MTNEEQKRIFSKNLSKYVAESGKQQKEIAEAIGVNPNIGKGKVGKNAVFMRISAI